jgi:hypothetical protein
VRRGSLLAAAALVAVVFFGLGAVIRLLLGPISLGPLSGELSDSISHALPGLTVRYDEAALQWSRDEGRVNLVVLGARVFDRGRRIVAQAPKAEVGLAAAPLAAGRIVVHRIVLVGVQLTLVHTMSGALRLGIEHEKGQSDVLERLRQALASGGASALTSFAVRQARLAFYDERTGLFVVAPKASLKIATDKSGGQAGSIAATVDAQIEISGHRAHLIADLKLPRDADTVSGDVSITGLDVNALGENAKALAFLKPYALRTDISGSFTLDHRSTRVRDADFGLGSSGTVSGFGHPIHVKSLRLVGRYDGRTGRLLIDDGTLAGDETRGHLSGSGNLAFNSSGGLEKGDVDLTVDKIAVNMPGVMQQAVTLARIAFKASYTPADNMIDIRKLLVSGGPLSASLQGKVTLSPGRTPAIAVTGRIAPITVANLLHYWPLQIGEGARDWLAANVSAGSVGPVVLKTDIAPGALDAVALPEDALNLSFPIRNATVTYVKGLTPLTALDGNGMLTGDTFAAVIDKAKVGALTVTGGKVRIPNLHVPGAPGDIMAHVDGSLSDVLALIDMPPLQYPSRFHVGTDSAKGTAAIDLKFHVPMVKKLDIDKIGISVKGRLNGLALSLGDRKVTNGTINLTIDNSGLEAAGIVNLAGSPLTVDWKEAFRTAAAVTTRITARGMLSDAARENLNFHSGAFLKGPVNVRATLEGHRGSITRAHMTMELTPATVTIGLINYRKPPGVRGNVEVSARFKDGTITGEDVVLSGAGLKARGSAGFGADGALERLVFPVVRAGPENDFALEMTETSAQGLKVKVTGRSVDGTGLGRTDLTNNKTPDAKKKSANEPFLIEANLDRVVLRDHVTLASFAFSTSGVGEKPRTLSLSGTLSKTARLSGDLVVDKGERTIRLKTNNAGLLLRGLFGFTSMRGGTLDLNAALSPKPNRAERADKRAPDYRGVLTIKDFTVVNQPFLTRLFSAGSLGGLIDLLGGKGIAVDQLDAPFSMHAGVLDIHDARANGPSIGVTAEGYLDRRNNKVALEGALAPIYGLNSVLGAIPVLGDVLVSRKGEGIIGMSYSVSGNADEPKIAVNPLSVLTPGILRRIFEGTPKAPRAAEAKSDVKPKAAPKARGTGDKEPDASAAAARPKPQELAPPPATTAPKTKTDKPGTKTEQKTPPTDAPKKTDGTPPKTDTQKKSDAPRP